MKTTITRRVFIGSTLLAGTAFALLPQGARIPIKIEPFKVIESVQEVLFPKGLQAPSASKFRATNYLVTVSSHSSFWAEDLKFLAYGAELLIKNKKDFFSMSPKERDEALRDFVSNNAKGERWVSLLLFYTIEALLSDPIYGGNRDALGWTWLRHNSGQPQPKKPFGELV
ncbi:MAG: gluconate 2-dehydrogenase subunit 3 family protein [Sulfurovum sp.]|nr:MAG: gluconate 2-dehydrogenase subunit 3 family protein [Sulfurovum sp.]